MIQRQKKFSVFIALILGLLIFEYYCSFLELYEVAPSLSEKKDQVIENHFKNFPFDSPVALEAVKKSYESQKKTFNECPLNEEDNLEMDKFVNITPSSNYLKESYQVTVKMNLIEKSLRSENGSIYISNCTLERIWKRPNFKETDKTNEISRGTLFLLDHQNSSIKLNQSGTIHLICYSKNKGIVFQYVYQIYPLNMTKVKDQRKKEKLSVQKIVETLNSPVSKEVPFTLDGCSGSSESKEKTQMQQMNVLMIGLDSMSYNNMRRVLPRTYEYLDKELEDNVILDNFNSVGENTFPNHIAMLCGLISSFPLNTTSELKKVHDYYPFIWKRFEELGYITMYHVDDPKINIFNYLVNGFLYSPTDIYNRAFNLQLDFMRKLNRANRICYAKKPVYRIFYDQIEQFVQLMNTPPNAKTPYFSLTFLSELTHDYLAVPDGLDIRMRDLIRSLCSKGFLDNTMLIVYGDHGNRLTHFASTEIGQYERSRPFMSIHLPQSFRNTSYMSSLKENRHKLATFLDIYQTLRHFEFINKFSVNLKDVDDPKNSEQCRKQFRVNDKTIRSYRGISLFEELKSNRSCDEALIPDKYCRNFKTMPLNNETFVQLTNYTQKEAIDLIVQQLNKMFNGQQKLCELYLVDKVNSFNMIKSGIKTWYKVVLSMSPGESVFDCILTLDTNGKLKVKDKPIRLSLYGRQSHCIDDTVNKNYCFCKKKIFENKDE